MDKVEKCCRCGCLEKMHNRYQCEKIQQLQAELEKAKAIIGCPDYNQQGLFAVGQELFKRGQKIKLLKEVLKYADGHLYTLVHTKGAVVRCRSHLIKAVTRIKCGLQALKGKELHPNKHGREDCADCPYPERPCSECINGAKPRKAVKK